MEKKNVSHFGSITGNSEALKKEAIMVKIKTIQTTLRRFSIVAMVIGLSLWAFPRPIHAQSDSSAASAVTIDINVNLSTFEETFTTTGDALATCRSGTAISFDFKQTGENPSSSDADTFHLKKELLCQDNPTGSKFTIAVQAANEPCGAEDVGGWHVVSGTGEYVDLRGGGHLVGTVFGPDLCDPSG